MIVFNHDIYLTDSIPSLSFKIESTTKEATYKDGSGSNILTFEYEINSGDNDIDGIELLSINKNGSYLKDSNDTDAKLSFPAHNTSNVFVKTNFASIQKITAPANNTYITNDELVFSLEFNENVIVSGSPRLSLSIGASTVYALYDSGSNSNTLSFKYIVGVSDLDIDGISLMDLS